MKTPSVYALEKAADLARGISQTVPEMKVKGFRIETESGFVSIAPPAANAIACEVERLLVATLNETLGVTPTARDMTADERFMLESFRVCGKDRQNFTLLMSHLAAGKTCTKVMSQHLARLADCITGLEAA